MIKLDKKKILLQNFGYTQMIDQPTHYKYMSSRINLLFTTNSKLLSEIGLEQTIYDKSHHNIIYWSHNLNISLPPPYYSEIWDYKSTDLICRQFANFISELGWAL